MTKTRTRMSDESQSPTRHRAAPPGSRLAAAACIFRLGERQDNRSADFYTHFFEFQILSLFPGVPEFGSCDSEFRMRVRPGSSLRARKSPASREAGAGRIRST